MIEQQIREAGYEHRDVASLFNLMVLIRVKRVVSSRHRDTRLAQRAAHGVDLFVEERRQIGAAKKHVLDLIVFDVLLPARGLCEARKEILPVLRSSPGHSGWPEHAAHISDDRHIDALFADGRHIGHDPKPAFRERRNGARASGSDVLVRVLGLRNHDVHPSRDKSGQSVAHRRRGDESPLHAGGALQQQPG